ncbi:MAG: HEPN domain protein [Candidatus Hydrogenedentes bacterium ADurb.Bin101]|nr:MAG: HEPN domain protein [Candidatus Hydrogenedentes bacterium ADurb.Bin101]HOC68560.1 HEPN domain-containing protein [Candidatus Hydrogenedentota bacterium]
MSGVEGWIEQAKYDFDTASAMFDSGRYLYVVFCCQQAIEKTLKAIIAKKSGAFPPKIHNLPRLAELAGIVMEPQHASFVGELSGYYVQTRYPEEIEMLGRDMDITTAQEIVHKTQEVMQWLFSLIK